MSRSDAESTTDQSDDDDVVSSLISGVVQRKRSALARTLTELESDSALALNIIRKLSPHIRGVPVVGVTGPPGAGKSTLANALVQHWRNKGQSVAVIAIDPSSPISKGSVLGDRIRMTSALDDDDVFVRSLSAQGYLGGISPAAVRDIDAFDAAGFDCILLETVGAGQSEVDVARIAEITIVVAAPGLGDDIQAIKSGVLEIADILVVNKADRDGAEQTLQQLKGALSIRAGSASTVPALKVSASRGDGIEDLVNLISGQSESWRARPLRERRERRARYLIEQAAIDLVRTYLTGTDHLGDVAVVADAVAHGSLSASSAAHKLLAIEDD